MNGTIDKLEERMRELEGVLEHSSKIYKAEIAGLKGYARREKERADSNGKRAELFELKMMGVFRLRDACEAIVATAHGNRYGLTTDEVLASLLLAVGEVEHALGPAAVKKILEKHGVAVLKEEAKDTELNDIVEAMEIAQNNLNNGKLNE